MTRGRKVVIAVSTVSVLASLAGVAITRRAPAMRSTTVIGSVLVRASDPRRQMAIAGAEIAATSEQARVETKSDGAGFFRLTLPLEVKPEQAITLSVRHSGYEPFEASAPFQSKIYIVRLAPLDAERVGVVGSAKAGADLDVGDLRVRYSVKTSATMNVGSFARTFEAPGTGGIECNGRAPCSPDGHWKALASSISYDPGEGDAFEEVRVSCIAGPCAFTSIAHGGSSSAERRMKVSALNWSDTTTFLVEAEVTRTQVSDAIRYSIPVVFGNRMDFTLPGTAEGPSIEGNLSGLDIVFPLGPKLLLSWAVCTLKTDADGAKLYRCDLKTGYRFR